MSKSKKYRILLADPAWEYKDKALAGQRGAACKYDVASYSNLASMPVREIAADTSVMFMWVTMPHIPTGLKLMESWGLEYKTAAFTWIKINPKAGTPFWGMGNWTRANPELCFLGVRGKPRRLSKAVHSIIEAPIREHSRKPDEIYGRIERLMGPEFSADSCLELFATHNRPGWDSWGNDMALGDVTIPAGFEKYTIPHKKS